MRSIHPLSVLRTPIVCLLLAACSEPREADRTDAGNPGGAGGPGGQGGGDEGSGGGGDGTGGGGATRCTERARLIYVVDQKDRRFSSFDPKTLTFADIGTLDCPVASGSPFSMAVDRDARAFVLWSTGYVFEVDTEDATCKITSFLPAQKSFDIFGMGFVSDAPMSERETLFVAGGSWAVRGMGGTARLGSVVFPGLEIESDDVLLTGWPELTGTGDAKLWGFFPSTPTLEPRIAAIDKVTGALDGIVHLESLTGSPVGWAFAFWGGDFWIFLHRFIDDSTVVYRVHEGVLTTAIEKTGRSIVGAGVSTCAPLTNTAP